VVEGAESQNIAYGGDALDAKSRYTWKVTVTDVDGNELESREGSFATALADGTIDSWQGAQWIGSERMYFDAAVTNYFSLDATIAIPANGTRAGIVLGADDYRLANEAMNIWGKAGQSRFVYEVDVTNAKKPQLNIYVVGMPAFEAQNDGDETKPAPVRVRRQRHVFRDVGVGERRHKRHRRTQSCNKSQLIHFLLLSFLVKVLLTRPARRRGFPCRSSLEIQSVLQRQKDVPPPPHTEFVPTRR
jgi:hypothetical protein